MNRKIMLTLIGAAFLISPADAMTREEAAADFARAGSYYREGGYRQAAELYENIAAAGWESGALYYNLANSYFRRGETGRAVLNYERAGLLIPRDEDLRHNKRFVYSAANLPPGTGEDFFQRALQGHIQFYTVNEMAWIIYAVFLAAALVHVVGRVFLWRRGPRAAALLFLIIVAAGYLGGLIYKIGYYRGLAFIVEPAEAKFEPREEAAAHFRLKKGSRVKVLRHQEPWVKVKRPDGRIGWILRESLEKL